MSNLSPTAITLYSILKWKTYPFSPVFFLLSTEMYFEIFPIHNGVAAVSESFALNLIIYVPLTNK